MNITSIPRHIDAGLDKVSPVARSIQGDNDGLTYKQERRINAMAKRYSTAEFGHSKPLTDAQTNAMHCEVARRASREFGRTVTPWNVKLAVKPGRHRPVRKTCWPIDAGEDAYTFVAFVADAHGMTLKDTLIMMVTAYQDDWIAAT